jgi:hypothetical protein
VTRMSHPSGPVIHATPPLFVPARALLARETP